MTQKEQTSIQDFSKGISDSFNAFSFIFNNKLGHYFIYPVIFTLSLILLSKKGIDHLLELTKAFVYKISGISPLTIHEWPDSFITWFQYLSEKTLSLVLWLISFYIAHKIIKYVVLIIMSPIMALLSERVEKIITGNSYTFSLKQLIIDIWRGVIIASRNIFIELGLIILIWLANILITTIFPPISIITAPLSIIAGIILSAYFYGFAMIDYINERQKLSIAESYSFVKKRKWLAVGNGLVFWAFINIPIIGTYLGTVFAPILCSTGAVLSLQNSLNISENKILETKKEIENKK